MPEEPTESERLLHPDLRTIRLTTIVSAAPFLRTKDFWLVKNNLRDGFSFAGVKAGLL